MTALAGPSRMLGTLAPHAQRLFRGGLAGGFAAMALYIAGEAMLGGSAVNGSLFEKATIFGTLVGASCALVGALAMPPALPPPEPAAPEHAPTESVLRMATRAELWIARARRYLIVGGVCAGVVWIPLMAFGLTEGRGEAIWVARVTSTAGVVAFLAVALLWWRRVVEIGRELREWRARVARLRGIEREILAEP